MEAALHPANLRWGQFDRNIENWEAFFGPSRIHYVLFDDLELNSVARLNEICEFLGARPVRDESARRASARINVAPEHDLPQDVREALTSHFANTVTFLERKLGRDLGHWLATSPNAKGR